MTFREFPPREFPTISREFTNLEIPVAIYGMYKQVISTRSTEVNPIHGKTDTTNPQDAHPKSVPNLRAFRCSLPFFSIGCDNYDPVKLKPIEPLKTEQPKHDDLK